MLKKHYAQMIGLRSRKRTKMFSLDSELKRCNFFLQVLALCCVEATEIISMESASAIQAGKARNAA